MRRIGLYVAAMAYAGHPHYCALTGGIYWHATNANLLADSDDSDDDNIDNDDGDDDHCDDGDGGGDSGNNDRDDVNTGENRPRDAIGPDF